MNSTLKNILVIIGGLIIGGLINSSIVEYGSAIIPVPEGVNPMDIESIKANVDKYSFEHFLVPLVAHSLGTLVAAFLIAKFTENNQKIFSLIPAVLFLIGGIIMAIMLPEFWKASIIDLLIAYFPMAYLGYKLAGSPAST